MGLWRNESKDITNKYGENADVDTGGSETIWSEGGDFNFLDTAINMDVLSSDDNDTSGGSGAKTIRCIGYATDNSELIQDIIMDGQTPVEIPSQLKIATRAFILTSGASIINEGRITFVDRATGLVTYQAIEIGEGQTLSAVQICPKDKKGIVVKHYTTFSKIVGVSNSQMRLRLRKANGSILTKYNITISSSYIKDTREYEVGGIEMLEGEIIYWEAKIVAANNTPIEAGFDITFKGA